MWSFVKVARDNGDRDRKSEIWQIRERKMVSCTNCWLNLTKYCFVTATFSDFFVKKSLQDGPWGPEHSS